MERPRNKTRKVKIKNLLIGGDAPVSVQSMTNKPLSDVKGTIEQIKAMEAKGVGLVRVAVRTDDEIKSLREVIKEIKITPLCADIHFDYRLALGAIEAGIDKVRINPGNIGDMERTRMVVEAAKSNGVPIRIGVNGGSIDKKKFNKLTPEALVESAMGHVHILEDLNFDDIIVSLKCSDIFQTIEANKLFSKKRNYPIHVGLTEAGYGRNCIIQSSVAIGHLLLNGIGDTIRVSMTGDPVDEIDIGYDILRSVGDLNYGIKIISCPTCGRTDPEIDLLEIAQKIDNSLKLEFYDILKEKKRMLTVAVMGCEVNGPGEASHADIGIAGARHGNFLLFRKDSKPIKITVDEVIDSLVEEIRKML